MSENNREIKLKNFLSVFIVDDEPIVRKTIREYLEDLGHKVKEATDGITALQLIEDNNFDLALIDIRMPAMDGFALLKEIRKIDPELSVVMISAYGNMESIIQSLRAGAVDFLTKPIKLMDLDAVLEKSLQIRRLRLEKSHLRETIRGLQISNERSADNRILIGASEATRNVREHIQRVVEANLETILLTGETGTGKEVVAHEIHSLAEKDLSSPFIAVSCPAIPETLVESELFGHVKGAFTGATIDRAGYFEMADQGTLFLDEIADLSAEAQASLLRVLETRSFRRVGGSKEIKVNVRVIAASNIDLEKNVKQGKFRRDLYYRLNIYTIHLLPLRERRDDIIPLAEHIIGNFIKSRKFNIIGLSPQAKQQLLKYEFPGNTRELKNIIERAVVLCKDGLILPDHLNFSIDGIYEPSYNQVHPHPDEERDKIVSALEISKWNRRSAANHLGIPYSTLRFKMQKYGIK